MIRVGVLAIVLALTGGQFIYHLPQSGGGQTVCSTGTVKYVKAAATGSGTGADWTNAQGKPTSPTRGTTYCFADGSYGSFGPTMPAESGSTLVTFKKATVADHGTSTGWSDTLGDGTSDFTDFNFDVNSNGFAAVNGYSEVAANNRGFTITNTSTNGTPLMNFGSGANDITVSYIDGHGNPNPSNTTCQILVDMGFESPNVSKSNITIGHSAWSGGDTNAQIHTATNIIFEYDEFSDNTSTGTCHGNVLLTQVCTSCIWRYNLIHGWATEGLFITFPGATYDSSLNQTWDIYGNIWYTPQLSSSRAIETHQDGSGWGPIKLYNNTFVGPNDFVMLSMNGGLNAASVAYNNLFYNCDTNGSGIGNFPTHDYSWTKTCVDADFAGESNEQVGSGDPFVNAAGGNYHLSAETTAGTTLSSPYNADRDGVTRGSIGTWDRGAYEK